MDKIIVEGGHPLKGRVKVSGAKNAALPILFSSILASGKHIFTNVPHLQDVKSTLELLTTLGGSCTLADHQVQIQMEVPKNFEAHYDLVRKMRASVLCLGPLLSRFGHARVSLPGGCAIGARPINLHLDALEKMGAELSISEGYVDAHCERLKGTEINFELVTVTGTENIMMAATLAEGRTILKNCAQEPEVVNLADYLIKMGAKISGAGTETIIIDGVAELKPAQFEIMPDRIEAGTLLIAGAITGGEIEVVGFDPVIIAALTEKMRESGFKIEEIAEGAGGSGKPTGARSNFVGLKVSSLKKWKATNITTEPYPGFATDLQAQFMALMCFAEGTCEIKETIFENRFMHVQELARMGADIRPENQTATIRGNHQKMTGAPVMATDLRASACLVLAGLGAKGKTTVNRIYHLDRGYDKLDQKLQSLGAKIQRVAE